MAEFDFQVKYKKRKFNAQADALPRLHTIVETVSDDDNDDIRVFELDMVRIEFRLNHNPNEVDFIEIELGAMDQLYAAMDKPALTNFNAELICVEGLLQDQLNDPFCLEIHR